MFDPLLHLLLQQEKSREYYIANIFNWYIIKINTFFTSMKTIIVTKMSTLITECANRLTVKFNQIPKDHDKINIKVLVNFFLVGISSCIFSINTVKL